MARYKLSNTVLTRDTRVMALIQF